MYIYLVILFLLLPELVVVVVSFNPTIRMVVPTGGVSLHWYEELWADPAYASAFALSLGMAVAATGCSLLLGGAAAYAISLKRSRSAGLLQVLLIGPLIVPGAGLGAALFLFLNQIYLTETVVGVLIAHTLITLPYTSRVLIVAFGGFDRRLSEAAESLGANTWTIIRRVVLPIVRPGIVAAALFSMIVSLDEFTLTLFVSGRTVITLPLQIFNSIEYGLTPTVAAASTALIAITIVVVVALQRLVGLNVVSPGAR